MNDVAKIEVAGTSVSVPIDDKKTLGEFISGLLGQPQTLEKIIDAPFSIDQAWLVHLCSLVIQRITQQNSPEPLTFEAKVLYRDGVLRSISSLHALEHFTETQNLVAVAVRIDITLLIHFPGKKFPERQQLIFSLHTNEIAPNMRSSFFGRAGEGVGQARIEIRHTERTWADDILNLICTELQIVQTTEGSLKLFLRKLFLPFATFLFPVSMVFVMFYEFWRRNNLTNELASKVVELTSSKEVSLEVVNKKVDILLSNAISKLNDGGFSAVFPMVISLVVSAIIFFLGSALAQPNPSFLILSRASEKNKKEVEEKQKRKLALLIGSMVLSIVLGVVGNFIYDKIK